MKKIIALILAGIMALSVLCACNSEDDNNKTDGKLKVITTIFPPYDFTVANTFFVNLYGSQSSQLLMVAAFGGYENVMAAYKVAINEGYRFGDYGDAMLIID